MKRTRGLVGFIYLEYGCFITNIQPIHSYLKPHQNEVRSQASGQSDGKLAAPVRGSRQRHHQLIQVEGFLLSWADTPAGDGEEAGPGGFDSHWCDTALGEAAEPGSGLVAGLL